MRDRASAPPEAEAPRPRPSVGRRLLFASVMTIGFLVLAEAALAALPAVRGWLWRRDVEGEINLLFVGDSVTAGFGVAPAEAWPQRVIDTLRFRHGSRVGGSVHAKMGARAMGLADTPTHDRRGEAFGLVLVMIGHNDVVSWDSDLVRRSTETPMFERSTELTRARWEPRLLRVWRWGSAAWAPQLPQAELPAGILDTLRGHVCAYVARAAPARVVLLTYLVPGTPPAGMDPAQAAFVARTSMLQRAGNDLIRQVGAEQGLTVLDVGNLAPVPAEWSANYFLDNIHPTAVGHADLAATAVSAMDAAGLPDLSGVR